MRSLEELDFSVRTYHVLANAGIESDEQIRHLTDMELRKLRFMSQNVLNEIRQKVPYSEEAASNETSIEALKAHLQENAVARTELYQRMTQAIQERDAMKKQHGGVVEAFQRLTEKLEEISEEKTALEAELDRARQAVCAKCKKPPDALPDGAVCGDIACPWYQYTKKGV